MNRIFVVVTFTVLSTILGFNSQAAGVSSLKTVSSLEGTYRVEGGNYYCTYLQSVDIKAGRDHLVITDFRNDSVKPYGKAYENINSARPKVIQLINGTSYERIVYKNGILKAQSKFFVFSPLESRYKDKRIILHRDSEGHLIYHFSAYGDTYCKLVLVRM